MSDLGLYEGCHVQLRNGETKGPLQREKNAHAKFPWSVGKHSWTPTGGYFLGEADPRDIVSVISTDSIVETPADQVTVAIREDVLAAAREAGLKARPAYDEFVSAIVESAFAAQSVTLAQPVVVDATTGQIGTLAPSLDEIVQTIAAAREEWLSDLCSDEDGLDRDFIGPAILRLIEGAQNESAPEIRPSEKLKGVRATSAAFRNVIVAWAPQSAAASPNTIPSSARSTSCIRPPVPSCRRSIPMRRCAPSRHLPTAGGGLVSGGQPIWWLISISKSLVEVPVSIHGQSSRSGSRKTAPIGPALIRQPLKRLLLRKAVDEHRLLLESGKRRTRG